MSTGRTPFTNSYLSKWQRQVIGNQKQTRFITKSFKQRHQRDAAPVHIRFRLNKDRCHRFSEPRHPRFSYPQGQSDIVAAGQYFYHSETHVVIGPFVSGTGVPESNNQPWAIVFRFIRHEFTKGKAPPLEQQRRLLAFPFFLVALGRNLALPVFSLGGTFHFFAFNRDGLFLFFFRT